MKWTRCYPQPGDTRIVKRFLLTPATVHIEGVAVTRWLELAYIKQMYGANWGGSGWDDLWFVTKEQYENYLRSG